MYNIYTTILHKQCVASCDDTEDIDYVASRFYVGEAPHKSIDGSCSRRRNRHIQYVKTKVHEFQHQVMMWRRWRCDEGYILYCTSKTVVHFDSRTHARQVWKDVPFHKGRNDT